MALKRVLTWLELKLSHNQFCFYKVIIVTFTHQTLWFTLWGFLGVVFCWWKRSGRRWAPARARSGSPWWRSGWCPCWGTGRRAATPSPLPVSCTSGPPRGAWWPRECKPRDSPPARGRRLPEGRRSLQTRLPLLRGTRLPDRSLGRTGCDPQASALKGLWGTFWIFVSPEGRKQKKCTFYFLISVNSFSKFVILLLVFCSSYFRLSGHSSLNIVVISNHTYGFGIFKIYIFIFILNQTLQFFEFIRILDEQTLFANFNFNLTVWAVVKDTFQ